MIRALVVLLFLASPALAQQQAPSPSEEMVFKQVGALLIQNAQSVGMIQQLRSQIAELQQQLANKRCDQKADPNAKDN